MRLKSALARVWYRPRFRFSCPSANSGLWPFSLSEGLYIYLYDPS